MLFNSYGFILVFLPVVFLGTFWLGRRSRRLSALWLGLSSLTFYAMWDSRFVLLLLGSISFNYAAGYWIGLRRAAGSARESQLALVVAIAVNLGLLGYFKYANFFLASAGQLLGIHVAALDIILPLGISFFTFTQIAFLVDVYRGIAREYNFIHYLLFVTYFPHLIAGPVLHHKQIMPQFGRHDTYRIHAEHVAVGLTIFVLGLSKKVLIADNLSQYATPAFDAVRDGQVLTLLEGWVAATAYAMQLYFDFSGYSDMAIGLSLMLNVRLPLNFDSPYKAINIIDFWRRWHITLSTFLRDYLYFPLGGNRKGPARRYVNLMLTMLLGGLWHGAGWTYVIWGGLHGLYLMINHGWRELKSRLGWKDGGAVARLASGLLTFVAVVAAWVFFRAENVEAAGSMLSSMFGMHGLTPQRWVPMRETLKVLVPLLLAVWIFPNIRQIFLRFKPTWDDLAPPRETAARSPEPARAYPTWRLSTGHAVLCGLIFFVVLFSIGTNKTSEFIYFQF